ncbi:MAG: SpoIIE family protein phosphatase [Ruminococcus sp.]|nr:SpoIIE family protein phosphatase [Ruminococcus sp.]
MKKRSSKRIAVIMTVWLSIILVAAYAVSAVLTYFSLVKRSENQTNTLVYQNVEDVTNDIVQVSDVAVTVIVEEWCKSTITTADIPYESINVDVLTEYCKEKDMEVNIVKKDGTILCSSDSEQTGKNISEIEKFAEFSVLLDGKEDQHTKSLESSGDDDKTMMIYGAKNFEDGSGFLMMGLSQKVYYNNLSMQAEYSCTNRRIGEKGYLLVCNNKLEVINSYHKEYDGKKLSDLGIDIDTNGDNSYVQKKLDVDGTSSYVTINGIKGNIYVIGVFPVSEAVASTKTMMLASILVELAIFAVLFVTLFILIRKLIVRNLVKVNDSLASITGGNLSEKIEVRDTYEFNQLSDDINATVDKLKDYIADAEARIDADLAVAKAIQSSALPTIFPPFPEYKQFELFASMTPAKQVGGDFYDFYMLGGDTLGFLIADVSGKSIPGAMFMMTAKTVIKSLAESGLSPAEVFNAANKKLCEGNDAQMFVTAWMGYLELDTGIVHIANAGHNPPMLIRDGKAEKVSVRPNFVLAGMTRTVYKEHTIQMYKGDILYLYTDGVTEAMDNDYQLYGEQRLEQLLSFGESYPEPTGENGITEAICTTVAKDIADFTNGAEQSDDITMVCISYLGNEND